MSEETQVVPEPDDDDDALDLEGELSAADYKKIISKLRKEAGARRLTNKEKDAKLAEYDEWKKSQMSEVDRVKAEKAELESEVNQYRMEKLRGAIAEAAGLPMEFADLIVGKSEKEMLAHAKSLKARLQPTANSDSMRPGGRGTPVGSQNQDDKVEWLKSLWTKS